MADRNRAQKIVTVSGRRDNPQQFETDRNRRQQQGGSQAAKNPVVEHKEASNRPWIFGASLSLVQRIPAWDNVWSSVRRLFDARKVAKIQPSCVPKWVCHSLGI